MESFDPIGGFRERYRASGELVSIEGDTFEGEKYPGPFRHGLRVDASGTTPDGVSFTDYSGYQDLMIEHNLKYVAQHFASQLLVARHGSRGPIR